MMPTMTALHHPAVSPPSTPHGNVPQGRPLLLFDGVCGLCNRFVDFILRHDRRSLFLFAPLQGETAAELLSAEERADLKSVVLIWNGREYRHSAAVVRILWLLGSWWVMCGWLLYLVPAPLRDLGYRLVARWRYRLFGQSAACRMPKPDEVARLLP